MKAKQVKLSGRLPRRLEKSMNSTDLAAQRLTDEELMSCVRSGATGMLGVLFSRYHVPLYNFFRRLTGNSVLSEDMLQEVFYRILRARMTYQENAPFRTWMYRIARNAMVDRLRTQPREVSLEPEHDPIIRTQDLVEKSQ